MLHKLVIIAVVRKNGNPLPPLSHHHTFAGRPMPWSESNSHLRGTGAPSRLSHSWLVSESESLSEGKSVIEDGPGSTRSHGPMRSRTGADIARERRGIGKESALL